ncbi:hypothetical protein F4604DRAFT_1723246, partial [Suillus subluteus]
SEFNDFQEILSRQSCDAQEELVACLERIRDVIKDNMAGEELIEDPAEVALDRLAVSLDWMPWFSCIMGMSCLRSPAFAAIGNARTHELYLKLTEITKDPAMNHVYRALLAQTSDSHRYTVYRRIVHTSVLSSIFFAFLALLGKLFMDRNGLYLNMPFRRKSRTQSFLRPSPFTPRWLMLGQLLLCIAFVAAHHLAL